jgi:hypothetical protein
LRQLESVAEFRQRFQRQGGIHESAAGPMTPDPLPLPRDVARAVPTMVWSPPDRQAPKSPTDMGSSRMPGRSPVRRTPARRRGRCSAGPLGTGRGSPQTLEEPSRRGHRSLSLVPEYPIDI